MIDHTGLLVTDLERSAAFYAQALAPLGYEVIMKFGPVVGLGANKKADLWLHAKQPNDRLHIAIRANSRSVVKAFYEAALAAGGTDNGAPGVREQYHPDYYAAFILDPDGHNIEAVCHEAYLG